MNPQSLLNITARVIPIWLAISLAGLFLAEPLGRLALFLIEAVLNIVAPEFSTALSLERDGFDYLIKLSAWVMQPIPIAPGQAVDQGTELTSATNLTHTLVPLVIEFTALAAWPVQSWRERMFLLGTGVVGAILLIAMTAPFSLLGHFEIRFQEMAQQVRTDRPEPFVLTWMIFLEMGGRWVLPVLLVAVCVLLRSHWFKRDRNKASPVGSSM